MMMRINKLINSYKFVGAVALMSLVVGCSTLELTPVADPATHEHIPGKMVWHDLFTQDAEKATAFYGQLFGWQFRQQGKHRRGEAPICRRLPHGQADFPLGMAKRVTESKSSMTSLP